LIQPTDSLFIDKDTVLQPGVYYVPNGIIIDEDGITLDGNGALLVGKDRNGMGVSIHNRKGVTIKNLRIQNYKYGIYSVNCRDLSVSGCAITATDEVPANTIFLNIWLPHDKAYGGGIMLVNTHDSLVERNDLQHQMNGMLSYHCQRLKVLENNASYCSGWGFHVYATSDSLYEGNVADYCCRWEPRPASEELGRDSVSIGDAVSTTIFRGHMGADAAGFLIIHSSSNNVFRRNLARLGGDGFFLAGLSPEFEPVPCNNNLFEENDGSWSPNIAFEATFSAGNIYRGNRANHCNYGFWLGFSKDGVIEDNQSSNNAQAGIAVENGVNFQVRRNHFQDNEHGVMLWSKHIPDFLQAVPENCTSADWVIENNQFIHNNKGVRIAANQDHGIRPYKVPDGEEISTWLRPHDHTLRGNTFKLNRIGIESIYADQIVSEGNAFERNSETDELFI
jgi:parallel beta-helix repeat protein